MSDLASLPGNSASLPHITAIADESPAVPRFSSFDFATALAVAEKFLDFMAVFLALYAADALQKLLKPAKPPLCDPSRMAASSAAFAVLFVFLLERHGAYRGCVSLLAINP
jgi:hypothetical protein